MPTQSGMATLSWVVDYIYARRYRGDQLRRGFNERVFAGAVSGARQPATVRRIATGGILTKQRVRLVHVASSRLVNALGDFEDKAPGFVGAPGAMQRPA